MDHNLLTMRDWQHLLCGGAGAQLDAELGRRAEQHGCALQKDGQLGALIAERKRTEHLAHFVVCWSPKRGSML